MSWYKVTMPLTDWEPNKPGQRLINDFAAILIKNGGPWDAAMFSQKSGERRDVSFYFSPHAARIASALLNLIQATPCDAPLRDSVILAAGDARAFDLLPLPPHQNN